MPPLLYPSPVLVNHSFPRNENELQLVAIALGEIGALAERRDADLAVTAALIEMLETFDWNPPRPYRLLNDIHSLLRSLLWRAVVVDVSSVPPCGMHPAPTHVSPQGLDSYWAEDAAKLLLLHDKCVRSDEYFVGIACERAFSNQKKGMYPEGPTVRRFPLVGPSDVTSGLDDAYEWCIDDEVRSRPIMQADVRRHFRAIGGLRCEPPQRDSHYKVRFQRARSWTFSVNDDPVPDRYVSQLEGITGYPVDVVRSALIEGHLPPRRLRLSKHAACRSEMERRPTHGLR